MTKLESLERLVRLRDAGALTDQEFASEKAKILAKDDQTSLPKEQPSVSSKPPSHPPEASEVPLQSAGVQTPEDAVGMARRAWASVTAMIASSVVAGIANSVAIFNGAAIDIPLSSGEASVFLVIVFVVEVGLAALFGWLTARKHSLFGAWALLVWAVWSLLYLLFDNPMKDGLAVLIGLIGLGGIAVWYAWVALRGVLAIRRFSRTVKGQQAIVEIVRAFRQEPRPTFREALAEGRQASKPTRNLIRVIGLCAIAGVLVTGLLFWLMSERRPDSIGHALEESGATRATPPTTYTSQRPAHNGDGSTQPDSSGGGDSVALDIQPSALVGVWDWGDGFCTNAESVHINADGTYWDGLSDGTWSLVGNTLILMIQGYDMQDGSGRPPPQRLEFTVAEETPNIFSLQSMDRQVRRLIRCEYRDGAQVQFQ